ncbi:MAG TPA: hypothetical protein VD907_00225 [Verrucomicrobiae bacterium]|nr:hypothetical protein [Verrucomicrobiae bacterium]
MKQPAHKNLVILTVILAVIAGIAAVLFISGAFNRPFFEEDRTTPPGERVVLSGEVVCLPHKDTSGMQTMECAFGLKTAQNKYYALRDQSSVGNLREVGQKVKVQGTLTAPAANEIYNIVGVVQVQKIEKQ